MTSLWRISASGGAIFNGLSRAFFEIPALFSNFPPARFSNFPRL
ncbi:hypothetical protein [Mesomycoplasma ovipneumoniae]